MPSVNKIKLNICATDYVLTTDEPDSYMRELGGEVDHDMRVLLDSDPRISTTMAAVMTALTNADRARKAEFAKANVYTKESCKNCWAKFYCSGGCNANNWQYEGNVLKPHKISCALEKKRLECAIMIKAALAE